ncbi:MAG: hypothetical protein MJ231_08865 [bacterium]|nr:hypothetical protein [bacterium]
MNKILSLSLLASGVMVLLSAGLWLAKGVREVGELMTEISNSDDIM